MNKKLEIAIKNLKEIKKELSIFNTKEEAIKFLIKQTKLSEEECSNAYDFLMKTDFNKEI